MANSRNIPNHLAWTIISTVLGTLLCCPLGLLGIVGIVYSSKVDRLANADDVAAAQSASGNAKTWAIVATVLGAIGLLLNIWFYSHGGMQAYMQQIQAMQAASGK
ncbi:CD225/dispanin family protein [Solilutibacter silvestris]|uniref:CD225/dispanin family protein n=1 Tax=Solilutibacter silvestris TaxID=1645665 RepID=UPI003D33C19C